jgi:hypothetical protein
VLRHFHPENRAEWSGSLAQYNLIGRCIQKRKEADASLWEKMLQNTGIRGNTTLVAVSPELKKMILDKLLGVCSTPRVKEWDSTRFHGLWAHWEVGMMPHEESSSAAQRALEVSCIQGMDFVSNVIIWHYMTNLCFFTKEASDNSEVASICMELSNYIMHLVAKHKAMVGSDGLYMLSRAQREVKDYLKYGAPVDSTGFSHKVCNGVPGEDLFAGLRQARSVYMELLQINEARLRWELIAVVWVEMLCYIAHNCGGRFHARHLSTHVKMLLIILGLPFLTEQKKTLPYITSKYSSSVLLSAEDTTHEATHAGQPDR